MATLNITEFMHPDQDDSKSGVILAVLPVVTSDTVTFTTSTQSSAFDDTTSCVRIVASADCYVAFGTNPTATTDSVYLPAGVVEYFFVPKGQSYKIAAYDGAS